MPMDEVAKAAALLMGHGCKFVVGCDVSKGGGVTAAYDNSERQN